jgi:hypothetical protein
MLSLQDVLSLSPNASEEELRAKGLLPQPAAPAAPSVLGVPPAAGAPTTPVAKMTPPVLQHPNAPAHVPSANAPAPEVAPMQAPENADLDIKPMTPPTLNFHQRQALPLTSPGVLPGSQGFYEGKIEREEDRKENPLGSEENHPGFLGKLGRIAGKVGNIALDVAAPRTAALIPGTDLNNRLAENANERKLEGAKKEETEEAAVKQRPEIAEATGALKERLEEEKEAAAQKKTETETGSKEKIAGEGNETKKGIASEGNATKKEIASEGNETKQDIASDRNKTQAEIEKERNESKERVAMGHNLATTEAARIRTANANDPDKLTNTMKTMKQQAVATLPSIDRALDETERVANKLGPAAGRWNDFWQGKVGADDPDFAHYKDEIAYVSTAITLAHARGRMSNELFEHFQKMFDVGKQAPQNMIQALNVAKEWLTDYSKLGETPNAAPINAHKAGGSEVAKPPDGKVPVYAPDGTQHFVLKDKVSDFLKDPKYKGWSQSAPAKQ